MTTLSHLAHGIVGERFYNKPLTGNTTAKAMYRYLVNTTSSPSEITLPAEAPVGFKFRARDYAGTFSTTNCTVKANGEKINNVVDDYILDSSNIEREFEKLDTDRGWIVRRVG